MSTYDVFYKAATKEVFIRGDADAAPAGSVSIGTFDHDADDPQDNLGPDACHPVYEHIRDLCYKAGLEDMSIITIQQMAASVSGGADFTLDISNGETRYIVPTFVPPRISAPACTFASSDATKATVDANGKVTPVAAGAANITVTNTASGKTDVVAVTVQA